MKRAPLALLACTLAFPVSAQQTPESFLGSLPGLPPGECQVSMDAKNVYFDRLAEARKPLEQEISRRNQVRREQDRKRTPVMPKLTKEQKDALADKMLQEKLGISLEEVRKMRKMSKEGKKAWAESVATEQIAVASAADPAAAKAEQEKNLKMLELTKELQFRQSELMAAAGKYATQLGDLDKEFEDEREKNDKADREAAERREASGTSDAYVSIRPNHQYCPRYSPRFRSILGQYGDFVRTALPACKRLEKLEYEMEKAIIEQANAANTGNLPTIGPPAEPAYDGGVLALGIIRDYLRMLEQAFKYDIDPPPSDGG